MAIDSFLEKNDLVAMFILRVGKGLFKFHNGEAIYFDQLRAQFQDLSRRIPSCGGGSVPSRTQVRVWSWLEYHFLLATADVLARSKNLDLMDGYDV